MTPYAGRSVNHAPGLERSCAGIKKYGHPSAAACTPSSDRSSDHKQGISKEEIAARILASNKRRAALPPPLRCPACAIGVGTVRAMTKHLSICCPDLIAGESAKSWEALEERLPADARDRDSVERRQLADSLLVQAARLECKAREEAIRITFRYHMQHLQRLASPVDDVTLCVM